MPDELSHKIGCHSSLPPLRVKSCTAVVTSKSQNSSHAVKKTNWVRVVSISGSGFPVNRFRAPVCARCRRTVRRAAPGLRARAPAARRAGLGVRTVGVVWVVVVWLLALLVGLALDVLRVISE